MKTLIKITVLLLLGIVMVGCGQQPEPEPMIKIKTEYVYKTVPCVVPKINCEFSGEGYTPTKKLLACVIEQKKALELCSGQNKEQQ